jgi:hypothetical protein
LAKGSSPEADMLRENAVKTAGATTRPAPHPGRLRADETFG